MKKLCLRCRKEFGYDDVLVTDDGYDCCPYCESLRITSVKEENEIALDALRTLSKICKKYNEKCAIYNPGRDEIGMTTECPVSEYCDSIYGIGFPDSLFGNE